MRFRYWPCISEKTVKIGVRRSVSAVTRTACMENSLEWKFGQRLAVNVLFGFNDWEVELYSGSVWKHRKKSASKKLQLIETSLAQFLARHKTCFALGAPEKRWLELRLAAHHTSKVAVVVFDLLELPWSWTGILESSAMKTKYFRQLVSANSYRIMIQDWWQRIHGVLVVEVTGSDHVHHFSVRTNEEIDNTPCDSYRAFR